MKTRVLYVEDEPFLGRIVKESLESRDFEVTMLTDGQQVAAAFDKTEKRICGVISFSTSPSIPVNDTA